MKSDSFLRKLLVSSWFHASIPAILIILFFHPHGSKFTLAVEPQEKSNVRLAYSDLNSDSISEIIYSGKGVPYYYIAVKDNDLRIYDQWNLADSIDPALSGFFFGNYDHDRFQEIYVFTHKADSLFLNVNEFLDRSGTKLERIFITKIGYLKGEVVCILKPAGFFDTNDDGFDELYFSISSGFRTGPRKLYYFDIVRKELTSSQFTGSICLDPVMADQDDDKRPEIFGATSASGNYPSSIPFSDSSTWFMVFNDKLGFEFQPEEFRGFANGLETFAYNTSAYKGYLLSHWTGGTDTSVIKSRLMIYSADGKLMRSRLYSDLDVSRYPGIFVIKHKQADKIYILTNKFQELNDNLELVRIIDLPFHSNIIPYKVDINADGEDEFLLYSEDEEKLAVYSDGLKKYSELKFNAPDPSWKFYHYYDKDHKLKLYMSAGNNGYFLHLDKNNLYYPGYLAYPGIYFVILLFILLIRRINTRQIEQRESIKRRLVTLQLQGIKSQLDPHFTFNTLNSVASLIYMDDRQGAYDYLNKFTQLLRSMLNDAERIYRNLDEELEFTTTYLDLEKLRFGEKFNYVIEVAEGVTRKEKVPKFVLHTFAENAVKHGIMPKDKGGMVRIRIDKEIDYLRLTIEDNGVGRANSEGMSTSTGRGLKLTGEFYDILNQINKKPIKHLITDLYNESGAPSGTRVEIWVPLAEE